MSDYTADFLIIGAGIVGLTLARSLKIRYPDCAIAILEKEPEVARHASGRNSGVLHAGLYYPADSLKAKFCREGNRLWTDYCREHGLRINACGKVVVAQTAEELPTLHELETRGKKNGVQITRVDEVALQAIEPNAKTHEYALHVPETAVIDPTEVCLHLKRTLQDSGVRFFFNTAYAHKTGMREIQAGHERFSYHTLINCAGLYADKIARDFGCSGHYTIIPFKGLYLKHTQTALPVRTNIYPVPNLANPFLGVHFTVTVDGGVKIGPTAIPAFWREHYHALERFSPGELASILGWEAALFFTNAFGFRALAWEETKKYRKSYMINKAAAMVKHLDKQGFNAWSKPGIRAQLLDKRNLKLVQDFVVEKGEHSIHVLNAVSPAFTCSLPFAEWIVDTQLHAYPAADARAQRVG